MSQSLQIRSYFPFFAQFFFIFIKRAHFTTSINRQRLPSFYRSHTELYKAAGMQEVGQSLSQNGDMRIYQKLAGTRCSVLCFLFRHRKILKNCFRGKAVLQDTEHPLPVSSAEFDSLHRNSITALLKVFHGRHDFEAEISKCDTLLKTLIYINCEEKLSHVQEISKGNALDEGAPATRMPGSMVRLYGNIGEMKSQEMSMTDLRNHSEQVAFVRQRDGYDAALAYAKQTLSAYRKAARLAANGRKTFAHVTPYRPHFVVSLRYLHKLVRTARSHRLSDQEWAGR